MGPNPVPQKLSFANFNTQSYNFSFRKSRETFVSSLANNGARWPTEPWTVSYSAHFTSELCNKHKYKKTSVATSFSCVAIFSLNFNLLNPELNPIYLLALLSHHFLHVSRIRVKSLTIRLLMSYIYGAPILDVSRSHTTTHHSR